MKFSPAASLAMREAFLDLYLLAGHLNEGRVAADMAEEIRTRAEACLAENRETLFSAGVPEKWVNEVELPLIGLVDEAARNSPIENLKDHWKPIQFRRYGHEEVGTEAFEHLATLRASEDTPVEVLEVYSRCLAAGFEGTYAVKGPEGLKIISEGLRNDIVRRQGKFPTLTPHLGATSDASDVPQFLEPFWIGVIAFAVVILVGLGMTASLSIDANGVEHTLRQLLVNSDGPSTGRPR